MYTILLPDSYKKKKFMELLPLLFGLERHDWGVLSYGLGLGKGEEESKPICAGIPTTCGSIIFWDLSFHPDKLLEYARESIPEEKYTALKQQVTSEEIFSGELREELGVKLVNSIALKHPEALDYLQYELLVMVPTNPPSDKEDDGDTRMQIRNEIKKLRSILQIYENSEIHQTKSRKTKQTSAIFNDAELHSWTVRYSGSEELLAAADGSTSPESMIEAWNDLSGDIEDEPEEPSYVILLRSEVDGQTSLKELENQIDAGLKPLEGTFSPRPVFITMSG